MVHWIEVIPMMALQLVMQLVAIYYVRLCYTKYPDKRWRFLALLIWCIISIFATVGQIAFVFIAQPATTSELFETIHWVNRTVSIIGYLSVAVTCWCIADYYKRMGYGQ